MDIMGMMKKAQAVQAKLQEAQEELGRLEVEGQAGGGMVSLTLNAKGELRGVAGPEIERLIQLLARLPGLGPRSARRAALHLIKKRER
jgi:hypothetical protein